MANQQKIDKAIQDKFQKFIQTYNEYNKTELYSRENDKLYQKCEDQIKNILNSYDIETVFENFKQTFPHDSVNLFQSYCSNFGININMDKFREPTEKEINQATATKETPTKEMPSQATQQQEPTQELKQEPQMDHFAKSKQRKADMEKFAEVCMRFRHTKDKTVANKAVEMHSELETQYGTGTVFEFMSQKYNDPKAYFFDDLGIACGIKENEPMQQNVAPTEIQRNMPTAVVESKPASPALIQQLQSNANNSGITFQGMETALAMPVIQGVINQLQRLSETSKSQH